jgi:hypothetical protein
VYPANVGSVGRESVGHEEDRVPVVVAAGVLLGQVRLRLLDQVVLVLTDDRFTTRAVQMRLHILTFAQVGTDSLKI